MLQKVYLEITQRLQPETFYFGGWCSVCGVLMLVAYMYLAECDGNCVKETQLQNLLLLLDRVYLQRLHNMLGRSSVCLLGQLTAYCSNDEEGWILPARYNKIFIKTEGTYLKWKKRLFEIGAYVKSKVLELGVNSEFWSAFSSPKFTE